jgi:hypothetical protein
LLAPLRGHEAKTWRQNPGLIIFFVKGLAVNVELVCSQLASSWMSSIDKGTLYRISGSETTGSSPSVIDSRQQWDGVSCGYYIPHYAALRGQGYSVDAINDMSRRDILRQIASRRKLVSECLQSFASA